MPLSSLIQFILFSSDIVSAVQSVILLNINCFKPQLSKPKAFKIPKSHYLLINLALFVLILKVVLNKSQATQPHTVQTPLQSTTSYTLRSIMVVSFEWIRTTNNIFRK